MREIFEQRLLAAFKGGEARGAALSGIGGQGARWRDDRLLPPAHELARLAGIKDAD